MEETSKAIEFLEPLENILIFSKSQNNPDVLGSALSLSYTLKKMARIVNLSLPPIPCQFASFFLPLLRSKNFIVELNLKGKKFSEVYYEKRDDKLKFSINTKEGEIEEGDISLFLPEKLNHQPEAAVVLGVEKREKLQNLYKNNFSLPPEIPILNIDNSPRNERFGKVNLVDNQPLSAITFNIIRSLDENLINQDIATLLILGIIDFSRKEILKEEVLKVFFWLKEKGIKWEKIIDYYYPQKRGLPQINLLKKFLAGLGLEKIPYIFFKKEDFQKTKSSPRDLGFVIEKIKLEILKLPSCLLLWETSSSNPKIGGIFYSPNPQKNKLVQRCFQGAIKGEGVLFKTELKEFESVKQKVLEITQ
jgi:nanoRNase/pAp phosphatase (c-di-AMP/oligoRNAs hydrolase)